MSSFKAKLFESSAGLRSLKGYSRTKLGLDFIAGLTVTAYLVPQVMAYSELAHVPPVHGLWAVIPCFIMYFILGSSRTLSVGPESTTALMTGAVLGPMVAGSPERAGAFAAALAIIVGLWCLLARVLKLGALANLLSQPILVGYMAGVAVLMIGGQLGRLSGTKVEGDLLFEQVRSFLNVVNETSLTTLGLGLGVLIFLIGLEKLIPRVPAALIAVLSAALSVTLLNLDHHGIKVIGSVPSGLIVPSIPQISGSEVLAMLLPAVGVALIAYSSNVLTARAFAAKDENVNADQELIALGGSSIVTGLFGGFPVSSSSSRTALVKNARSATPVYSLISAGLILLVLLFAGRLLEKFPVAALGAVVVYAASKLIDFKEFRRLLAFRRSEAALAVLTCAATLVFGILPGIMIAIGVSVAELILRVSHPHDSVLGQAPGVPGMHSIGDYPDAKTIPGLVIYRYDSPLFFANAEDFYKRALQAFEDENTKNPIRWFVFNAEASVEVDITGVDALTRLIEELHSREVTFAFTRVKKDLEVFLKCSGVADLVGEDKFYPTLPTAVEAFQREAAKA